MTSGCCVSGTIGGILYLQITDQTEFTTDNFLGKVYATAFTGGFIGYNRILPDYDEDAISYIRDLAALIAQAVSGEKSLSQNVEYIDESDRDAEGNTSDGAAGMLTIRRSQEHETEQSMRFRKFDRANLCRRSYRL